MVIKLFYYAAPIALLIALAGTAVLGSAGRSMQRAFKSFFIASAIISIALVIVVYA